VFLGIGGRGRVGEGERGRVREGGEWERGESGRIGKKLPLPSSFFLLPSSFFLLPSSFFLRDNCQLPVSFDGVVFGCKTFDILTDLKNPVELAEF
jgi:hypothetical protein